MGWTSSQDQLSFIGPFPERLDHNHGIASGASVLFSLLSSFKSTFFVHHLESLHMLPYKTNKSESLK